jgi:hypothetical protein
MSTHVVISDAALEAMLARRANRADPGSLHDDAFARLDATEPRRHLLAWPVSVARGGWSARQVVLVAAAMLLLAAAVSGALIGARLLDQARPVPFDTPPQNLNDTTPVAPFRLGPRALAPTGIEVLVSVPGWYTHLVADGEGIAWLREDTGAIVRFDPLTHTRQSWSVADDVAFGSTEQVIPARSGGVWLVGQRALWWFDGEGIRDAVETPADLPAGSGGNLAVAAEAPDGTLWAVTRDGAVLHREGASWSRRTAPPGSGACAQSDASCFPSAIAVDRAGRPWIGWSVYPDPPGAPARVSRYDGTGWITLEDPLGRNEVLSISEQTDGSMLVDLDDGFARLDGSSWTEVPADFDPGRCTSDAPDPDGTVRCVGPGTRPDSVRVFRFDGRTWVPDVEGRGLPADAPATVVAARAGSYVAVVEGSPVIYQLAGDRWEPAWEVTPPAVPRPRIPGDGRPLLAISRDELWAIGQDGGIWHFSGGAWTMEAIDPAHPGSKVWDVALAPDGTAWAAGEDGVAYWRDGRWVVIDTEPANVVTLDRDGTAWVNRTGSACDLWTLRSNGTTWVPTPLPACPRNLPLRPGFLNGIAVDDRGALWVGAGGYGGAVARWAEGRWATNDASDGVPNNAGVEVLGISAAGDVWIGFRPPDHGANEYARFDGTEWKVADPPGGDLVLDPDGSLWAATDRGPAHYDGQKWTFPYPSVSSPTRVLLTVAPDGTVFALGTSTDFMATSIWRFPAPAP